MKKLGLIINPIAGMGGKVGLKGTDGEDVLAQAVALGAEPESPRRAAAAIKRLHSMRDRLAVFTGPGEMGENVVRSHSFEPRVIDIDVGDRTTARHTREVAARMLDLQVDLFLFAGGDGTARDIVAVVQDRQICLGIPTGVKMHSAVFAVNPARAGDLAASYLSGEACQVRAAEVMDIDEPALREGYVTACLYGYLMIPFQRGGVQGLKAGSSADESSFQEAIATDIIENMEEDVFYVIGPGTTTAAIMKSLGLDFSLVGVDVIRNKNLEGKDLTEKDLLHVVGDPRDKIVVTPIGGQGYLFGRGNQPISADVIRRLGKENIIVVATPQKLSSFRGEPLRVDTGESETDRWLSGYYKVVTGYRSRGIYRVSVV